LRFSSVSSTYRRLASASRASSSFATRIFSSSSASDAPLIVPASGSNLSDSRISD
jgi:hypothetical protein